MCWYIVLHSQRGLCQGKGTLQGAAGHQQGKARRGRRRASAHLQSYGRGLSLSVHHVLSAFALSSIRDLQSGTAHERTADQLKDELGTLRERLEMLLATDEGVIEQYERRKEEVCLVMILGYPGCEVMSRASTDQVIDQENRRP